MPRSKHFDASLQSQVDLFVTRITKLVRKATAAAVRDALANAGSVRARRGGGRVRRSSADLDQLAARILAYIRAHPGERLEEIGRGLKRPTAGLKRPIQMLLADRKLRTEGQKRGTKYFVKGKGRKGRRKA